MNSYEEGLTSLKLSEIDLGDSEDYMTFKGLQSFIANRDLNTIDDLIKALPKEYKENFTLVHSSQSLQGASYQNPRAVVFGPDASLVMTFNGDPSQKGYNNLEILHWDKTSKQLELREVTFDKDGVSKPIYSEANPQKCMQCHSASPKPSGYVKPVMSDYAIWNGFYGSRDDSIFVLPDNTEQTNSLSPTEVNIVKKETSEFLSFKQRVLSDPSSRYYDLLTSNDSSSPYYPYRYNGNGDYVITKFDNAPNTRLTSLLYTRQTNQFAVRILTSKLYTYFKYSLAATLSCKENLLPAIQDHLSQLISKSPKNNLDGSQVIPVTLDPFDSYTFEKVIDHFSIITQDEWNLGLGVVRDELSDISYKTPMEKSEGKLRLFNQISFNLLSQEQKENCFPFKDSFGATNDSEIPNDIFIDYSNQRWPSYICPQACSIFEEKAQSEIATFNANYPLDSVIFEQMHVDITLDTIPMPAHIPQVVGKCVGCHSESRREFQIGPYIPFTDRNLIQSWSGAIQRATDPNEPELRFGGRLMPLGQVSLTEEERSELLNYVTEN